MSTETILGIDVGGTHTRIGLVNSSFELLDSTIVNTQSWATQKDNCNALIKVIQDYLKKAKLDICMISIGLPSTMNHTRSIVLSTPNIVSMDNIPLVSRFEDALGIRTVVERDSSMLLMYDLYSNQIPLNGTAIGIYFGTGIGNAIIVDGKLLIGRNGVAGEIGHIPCLISEKICSCGNRGCMETYISGRVLEEMCRKEFPQTHIQDLFLQHGNEEEVQSYIKRMAIPIATEINIFDPDRIIIGGGIVAMRGFPYKILEENIYEHVRKPMPAQNIEIIYSKPSQFNGIIGAAIYAENKLKD
ncbi:allose kinase [Mediterraneibacter sp. NSJ-55]|uniref:Allose kinase n=1 Tax=Mediterraneibacter hominis TaxID=2763054 RepID=A0A923LLD9_9FIRM|nr:allose kinase [Mediterraneibacter hominis]MBC5690458.1 allose kinase [Mediterraneibacter hominis]